MKTGNKAYYRLDMRKVMATSWREGDKVGTVRYYSEVTGKYYTMLVHESELTLVKFAPSKDEEKPVKEISCDGCNVKFPSGELTSLDDNMLCYWCFNKEVKP